jgi:hypothetical protein
VLAGVSPNKHARSRCRFHSPARPDRMLQREAA